MHNINLKKIHTTQSGSLHVQVDIDGKDSGLLYLTPSEADLFVNILQRGCSHTGDTVTSDIYSSTCFDETEAWEEIE